jgi:hypothetical protein
MYSCFLVIAYKNLPINLVFGKLVPTMPLLNLEANAVRSAQMVQVIKIFGELKRVSFTKEK